MRSNYRCYVISLRRYPEKRAEFLERNGHTGLPLEIFEAMDGQTLTLDECVRNGLIEPNIRCMTQGRLGACSSHRALWTEAVSTNSTLLIFEDDVYCRRDIATRIGELLPRLGEWDIVLLGFNADAVLDFQISGQCNFAGFFSNQRLSPQLLEQFTQESGNVACVRLNNAFGLCAYLVSPRGAGKLLTLFPLRNRRVHIPGNQVRFGREYFRAITLDTNVNALYRHIAAYVTVPPLALSPNDPATSSILNSPTAR